MVVKKLEVREGRVVYDASSQYHADATSLVLSKVGMVVSGLSVRHAKNCFVRGEVSSRNQTGKFEVAGQLDALPLFEGPWKGKCRVRLIGCPLSALRFVQSWTGFRLPFSRGNITMAVNLTGSPGRFQVNGTVQVSRAVLSWKKAFPREVPLDNSWVEFALDRVGERIQLDVSHARLPGLSIAGEARLDGISGNDASLTIALRNTDIDLEKSFPLIPLNLLKKEERDRLERAGLRGRMRITGGAWTGKIADLARGPSLRGTVALEAVLEKVSGFVPGLALLVENATGTVQMNSEKMLFRGISLTVGSSPIVLNGFITNLKKTPTMDVFVSMEAQAQDLYPLLSGKSFAGSLGPWLQSLIDPSGGVSVTLDLKGNPNRPRMKGRIALKDFRCGIHGFPLAIKGVNGSLRFRPTGISVSEMHGIIGTSPAEVKGGVSSGAIDLHGSMRLTPADFRKLCKLPQHWNMARDTPISVDVSGTVSKVDFSTTVDLSRTVLNFGSLLKKKAGAPLKIEASGSVHGEGLVVEEGYLIFGRHRIAVLAKMDADRNALISLNLPPKGVLTRDLIPFVHPSLELQPGGRVEGDATLRLGRFDKPMVDANLKITHVSMRLPGFHKRTAGIVAAIRQKGKNFRLTVERAQHGSSVFSGVLAVTGLSHPKVDVELAFSFLDVSDFLAPPGYVSDMTWGEWIRSNAAIRFLDRSSGKGFVEVLKGKWGLRTFSDFKARIEGEKGLIKARSWEMHTAEGILKERPCLTSK